jgi:hypothetical protein
MSNLKCQINFKAQMCMLNRVKCVKWKVLRVMDYPFCVFSHSTLNSALFSSHGSAGSAQAGSRFDRLTAGRASKIE